MNQSIIVILTGHYGYHPEGPEILLIIMSDL